MAFLVSALLTLSFLGALFAVGISGFLIFGLVKLVFHVTLPLNPFFIIASLTPVSVCLVFIVLARRRFKAGNMVSSLKISCVLLAASLLFYFYLLLPVIFPKTH